VTDSDFVTLEDAIERANIIILGAPHSLYHSVKIPQEKQVVDIWGFWRERQFAKAKEHHAP
jgi:hypothetical protein